MHVVCVTVRVKPGAENIARWEEEARKNHVATRQEPGNVRFDVLRAAQPDADPEAPVDYFLYEVYHTPEDFAAHQQTPHYLAFRENVADLMAEPRRGTHFVSLQPSPWE